MHLYMAKDKAKFIDLAYFYYLNHDIFFKGCHLFLDVIKNESP